jgi:hypothetical protein
MPSFLMESRNLATDFYVGFVLRSAMRSFPGGPSLGPQSVGSMGGSSVARELQCRCRGNWSTGSLLRTEAQISTESSWFMVQGNARPLGRGEHPDDLVTWIAVEFASSSLDEFE